MINKYQNEYKTFNKLKMMAAHKHIYIVPLYANWGYLYFNQYINTIYII